MHYRCTVGKKRAYIIKETAEFGLYANKQASIGDCRFYFKTISHYPFELHKPLDVGIGH